MSDLKPKPTRVVLHELSMEGEAESGSKPEQFVQVLHSAVLVLKYDVTTQQRAQVPVEDLRMNDIVAHTPNGRPTRWLFLRRMARHINGEWEVVFSPDGE